MEEYKRLTNLEGNEINGELYLKIQEEAQAKTGERQTDSGMQVAVTETDSPSEDDRAEIAEPNEDTEEDVVSDKDNVVPFG